jgi:hypothetical protein
VRVAVIVLQEPLGAIAIFPGRDGAVGAPEYRRSLLARSSGRHSGECLKGLLEALEALASLGKEEMSRWAAPRDCVVIVHQHLLMKNITVYHSPCEELWQGKRRDEVLRKRRMSLARRQTGPLRRTLLVVLSQSLINFSEVVDTHQMG